jgi:hypothetical protein
MKKMDFIVQDVTHVKSAVAVLAIRLTAGGVAMKWLIKL